MTNKQRGTTDKLPFYWLNVSGRAGVNTLLGSGETVYGSSYETIISSDGRHRFNPCSHVKLTRKLHYLTSYGKTTEIDGYTGNTQDLRGPLLGCSVDIQDLLSYALSGPSPEIPLYGEIEKRASGTDGGPQLLNFLAELSSLKGTVLGILNVLKRPDKGLLSYDFGVKPFVSDLKRIREQIISLDDRWDTLYANAGGKPVKHNWGGKGEVQKTITKAYPASSMPYGVTTKTVIEGSYKTNFSAMTSYSHFPASPLGQLAFALSSFGFDNVLSSPWEAIPFSFVLDWFFGIGRTLQSIEPESFRLNEFSLGSMGASIKTEGTWTTVVTNDIWCNQRFTGKTIESGTFKRYTRYPVWRVNVTALGGSGLTGRKAAQAGALISSRK